MKRIWQRLSARERTLVITGSIVFFLVLGRYVVLGPLMERREWVRSQLEIQPQLLEKNLRYLGQGKNIETALEKAKGELVTLEAGLLPGDTPPVSASNLQETLQLLAAKDGIQVITTRVLNPEPAGSFTKIPLQAEVGGQLDQIVNLIKALESADKLLVVSELNVRSLITPTIPRVAAPAPPVQNLRASIIVAGFTRTQPPPVPKSPSAPAKGKTEDARGQSKTP
jgi:type II secretory pathway component PulM